MGRASRDKGSRVERELAKKLTEAGIPTRRVIGSGAFGSLDSRLAGDLQIGIFTGDDWLLTGEVKARKDGAGFAQLDGWLGDDDILLLKRNRAEPMAYMPWRTLVSLLEVAYKDELNERDIEIADVLATLRGQDDGDNLDSGGDMSGPEHLHGGKK